MNRFFLALFASLLASYAMADGKQTLMVDGHSLDKTVSQITFDGDDVVLVFADETTQTTDMSLVKMVFTYDSSTGISPMERTKPLSQNGKVYNLNGQFVGTTTKGLSKGIYIVNGKKWIVK